MKKYILALLSISLMTVAGCGATTPAPSGTPTAPVEDTTSEKTFSAPGVPVTFRYQPYLQVVSNSTTPGSATLFFRKRAKAPELLDQFLFSTKTHDAWKLEADQAAKIKNRPICESEAQFGCEKWDEDFALYQKAINQNNFDGYYALAGTKTIINKIPYIVLVTYNVDTKQYQTTYLAYVNNTRITFVDPAAGALEYGQPFHMTAKNRTDVETLAKNIAIRKNLDSQVNARVGLLYDIVSTVQFTK